MITFKPVVYAHQKRRDGTYNVKIKITFRRKARHLPTTLFCKQSDLTRSLRLKTPDIINRADELCSRMRAACADLTYFDLMDRDVDYVVQHICNALGRQDFRLDFFEYADRFIQRKLPATSRMYVQAVNEFERYLGARHIDINDISKSMLQDFSESIRLRKKLKRACKGGPYVEGDQPKAQNGQERRILIWLSAIYNAAKVEYNDEDSGVILIPRSPFSGLDTRQDPGGNGQKNVGEDVIRKIISAETSDRRERMALDLFVVSFGLMGANMADLYAAQGFSGDVWVYNRQKTSGRRADKAEMRVRVPAELHPFLERLKGSGGWWLSLHEEFRDKDACTVSINRKLKIWARENGVPEFTFYAARHSWASLARKAGVEKATIDECLAHIGDYNMADIYAERDWEIINNANRKVLGMFDWL